MTFWAVARTAVGREAFASARVQDGGFEIFLPRTRLRTGKTVALFPGYFFVTVETSWRGVEKAIGVIGLIMAGNRPAACPDREIEQIRAGLNRNGLYRLPTPGRPKMLENGQIVRIKYGSFRGLQGLYYGQSAREREFVLLELLGRRVPVELPGDALDIAPKENFLY